MAMSAKYLYGKEINYKTRTCGLNGEGPRDIEVPVMNLYVVLTRSCNVNCRFCTFHSGKSAFDIEKFKSCVNEISKQFYIGKVSFTGGEPTLNVESLKAAVDVLKQADKHIFTSVNTNGTNLECLKGIDNLDNIALSRHAIKDVDNEYLMGNPIVKIASRSDILSFQEKEKLHLSCNLTKGFIDSADKVVEYLEFASELGVDDVGFVSLMPVNEFARAKFIDFKDLKFNLGSRFINNKRYCKYESEQVVCRCNNYLYTARNARVVMMYSRYVIDSGSVTDYLVYEDNHLKQGFSGEVII